MEQPAVTAHVELTELDNEIASIERCLDLARENDFGELVSELCNDIRQIFIPQCGALLCVADGELRKAIALRYQRLQHLVSN